MTNTYFYSMIANIRDRRWFDQTTKFSAQRES